MISNGNANRIVEHLRKLHWAQSHAKYTNESLKIVFLMKKVLVA